VLSLSFCLCWISSFSKYSSISFHLSHESLLIGTCALISLPSRVLGWMDEWMGRWLALCRMGGWMDR
jgi:hypothetical protein